MWFQNFFKSLTSTPTRRRPARRRSLLVGAATRHRPRLEQLEDRTLLSNFTAATVADLIADIHAANLQGGSNTISLVAPLASPYVLTAADNTTDGATGLPLIAAQNNLTIFGNGNTIERSTAAATPAFRLLDVASGAALTLENLTLQGGWAHGVYGLGMSASGGAILSAGSLTLNGVTMQRNTAEGRSYFANSSYRGDDGRGGALYVLDGTVTMSNSTLSANQVLGGKGDDGGPYVPYGRPGGDGGNGLGGAVYISAGAVVMTSDALSANTAQGGRGGAGGAGYTDDYNYYTYGGDGGDGGAGFGSGLYAAGGTVTLTGTAVSSNSAWAGAGGPGGGTDPSGLGGVPGRDGRPGLGQGGGLFIAPAAPPLADLDTYTESNTINNFADIDPNISGPYFLNGTTTQPSSFTVRGFPSSTTAGVAGTFTVTAENADGSIDASYTGTVHFTSSDGQAVLPADYTFTAADGGVHTFSATLKTAGTQSVTAADATTFGLTGTDGNITVNAAAASTMNVAGFASSTTAGVAGNITITLKDAYGNTATGYNGTVHFTSSDGKAILPADYTFTSTDAGLHTFSATLKKAGTQSIKATDPTTASLTGTDAGITVNPAAASKFIIAAPSGVRAGVAFSLTITVEDAYGNVVTGYTGTVHFTGTDPKAPLPKNYTFTAADKGVHTFSGLVLRKKGTQQITITDTLHSSLTGSVIETVL